MTEQGTHYHLIDVDTGKVIEFEDPEHIKMIEIMAKKLGFELVQHRLELFGRRIKTEQDS